MGLYLCIFDEDDEIDGVEVGSYADFEFFRNTVTHRVENGLAGSICPTLILHADSDGEWAPIECQMLSRELEIVSQMFWQQPAIPFHAEWQQQVGKSLALTPAYLFESFIDVDGEPLLERLLSLCNIAIDRDKPIVFQ